MADRTFTLKFLGDISGAMKAVGGLEDKLTGSQKVMSGVLGSNLVEKLGAGSTERLLNSVEAASALNEAHNAASVTFGQSIKQLDAFANANASAFGLSKRQVYEYGSTLGGILKSSGYAEDAASGMSVEILQLAGDLASLKNLSVDEALLKIRSGLVGESEPLRSVGVLLDEAATKQKAYQMGLAKQGSELTTQQKVQARYALIFEQTSDAHGDAIRTGNELAGTQRRMKAEAENTAASLGGPAAAAVTTYNNAWLGLPPIAREIGSAMLTISGGLVSFLAYLPFAASGFSTLAGWAGTAAEKVGLLRLGLSGGLVIGGLLASLYVIYAEFDKLQQKATDLRFAILNATGQKQGGLLDAVLTGVGQGLTTGINPYQGFKMSLGQAQGAWQRLTGGGNAGLGEGMSVEGFANGGVVGGPRGAPRLVVAHGGETITPPGRGGGMPPIIFNGTFIGDEAGFERAIVSALTRYRQRGGLAF